MALVAFSSADPTTAALRRLEYLGEATLPAQTAVSSAPLGGLSGLTYDPDRGAYYAVSDDPSKRAPARFYTLSIDLADGRLEPGDVRVVAATALRTPSGTTFAEKTLDPEGIARSPAGTLYISSEGQADQGVAPWIREFSLDGSHRKALTVDQKFIAARRRWLPGRKRPWGVRHNRALESLTLSPGGSLFTATESALHQDGPEADLVTGSPVRIVRYDSATGEVTGEYVYVTEPVPHPPIPAEAFRVNGLVELVALDEDRLLALERAYATGVGNQIRLFSIALGQATDVAGVDRLDRVPSGLQPVEKTFLLDLSELGVTLENLEGLSPGPRLADGRETLIVVSDDNFRPESQTTQFLAFAWSREPAEIASLQGYGHRSPWARQWVFDLPGVVTAVDRSERRPGFWMQQSPDDGEPAAGASRGLFVSTHRPPALVPGDRVSAAGRIEEAGRQGQLTVTRLAGGRYRHLERGTTLPPPVRIGSPGSGSRSIPSDRIDDDGLEVYEPAHDAIDFFESLEGMRVEIDRPVVVGPGDRFGGCVVVAGDGGRHDRTVRGGLLVSPGDSNPERIVVSAPLAADPDHAALPRAASVGDRFSGPIVGVLHYDFGSYRVLPTEPLPDLVAGPDPPRPAPLAGDREHLTLATYNLWNLEPGAAEGGRLERLARSIVDDLGAPDLLAVQEVQDSSGPEDDGVVSATETFKLLVLAIEAAGGPRYDFRQIDPVDNADGGRPGGNIRVGYLFDPKRLRVTDRGAPGTVEVKIDSRGPLLSPNPGRLAPEDKAFVASETLGYEPSRKPLALEADFCGRRVFLINLHLRSKRADDRLFGARQPPLLHSEEQRSEQAARVRLFVEEILAVDARAAVIVLGDLNDYTFRAPIEVLAGERLENLVTHLPPDTRYTFVYQGNSMVLDHVLVSRALSRGAEIQAVHINADLSHGTRSSDHDPLLARLAIGCP